LRNGDARKNQTDGTSKQISDRNFMPSENPKTILRNNHGCLKGGFKSGIPAPAMYQREDGMLERRHGNQDVYN
jgi:hypothetical protein